jgi:hypothetical protein
MAVNKRLIVSFLSIVVVAGLVADVSGTLGRGAGYAFIWLIVGLCSILIGILAMYK